MNSARTMHSVEVCDREPYGILATKPRNYNINIGTVCLALSR